MRSILAIVTCFIAMATPALAQDVELDWYTIEPSAKLENVAEKIELMGTAGQADASPTPLVSDDGTIELVGGFWAAVLNESGTFHWGGGGGFFNEPDQWGGGGVPDDLDIVVIDQLADIQLAKDASCGRLEVYAHGLSTFDFMDTFLTLQGSEEDAEASLIIYPADDSIPDGLGVTLQVRNNFRQLGGIRALSTVVGDHCPGGGTATLIVTAAQTLLEVDGDFWIGRSGKGRLIVNDAMVVSTGGSVAIGAELCDSSSEPDGIASLTGGGTWCAVAPSFIIGDAGAGLLSIGGGSTLDSTTANLFVGGAPGGIGTVNVAEMAEWIEHAATLRIGEVGSGTVTVEGVITVDDVAIGPNGEINGSGQIITSGLVHNGGVVRAGTVAGAEGAFSGPGGRTLNLTGIYLQTPTTDLQTAGAAVFGFHVDEQTQEIEHDVLDIQGPAFLAGGMFIELDEGVDLPNDTFEILRSSNLISDAFDVGFYPGLPGRIMNVCLNPACSGGAGAAGAGSVNIVVQDLEEFLNFGGSGGDFEGGPVDAILGDFDGDLDEDLAIAVENPGAVVVLTNEGPDGNGGIIFTQTLPTILIDGAPVGLTAGYFDADTQLDLALARSGSTLELVVLINNGGAFVEDPQDLGFTPAAIARGDMNGDGSSGTIPDPAFPGMMDLVVANAGDSSIQVFGNDGGGLFTPLGNPAMPQEGSDPSSIDPLDVDNDKDLDLAIAFGSGFVGVFMNDDDGDFGGAMAMEFPVGQDPVDIVGMDLNEPGSRDPFPEIVTANAGDGTVSVIVNSGGTLQPAVSLPVVGFDGEGVPSATPMSLVVADYDQDTDNDIIVAASGATITSLQVLRNDIDPGATQLIFGPDPEALPDVAANPVLVLTGDLDNDADPDFVSLSGPAGPQPAGGTNPFNVIVKLPECTGDTNGDGTVDVSDLVNVILAWGTADPDADVDGNGVVDVADLVAVILGWGPCPS